MLTGKARLFIFYVLRASRHEISENEIKIKCNFCIFLFFLFQPTYLLDTRFYFYVGNDAPFAVSCFRVLHFSLLSVFQYVLKLQWTYPQHQALY